MRLLLLRRGSKQVVQAELVAPEAIRLHNPHVWISRGPGWWVVEWCGGNFGFVASRTTFSSRLWGQLQKHLLFSREKGLCCREACGVRVLMSLKT